MLMDIQVEYFLLLATSFGHVFLLRLEIGCFKLVNYVYKIILKW